MAIVRNGDGSGHGGPDLDGGLLDRARQGDKAALSALLGKIRPYLKQVADRQLQLFRRPDLGASDIAQDASMKLFQAIQSFAGTQVPQFLAFAKKVVKNDVIDKMRGMRGKTSEPLLDETICLDSPAGKPADQTSPSMHVARKEEHLSIRDAVAALPKDQAAAIAMHDLDEQPISEIAARLQRTQESVASLIKRGRKALATALSKQRRK